jgi:hypothetical protein
MFRSAKLRKSAHRNTFTRVRCRNRLIGITADEWQLSRLPARNRPVRFRSLRRPIQLDPCWRMVARLLPSAHLAVDSGTRKSARERVAEQQVIDPQPGIARVSVPEIVPEGVDTFSWWSVQSASVHPWATGRSNASRTSGWNSAFEPPRVFRRLFGLGYAAVARGAAAA